MSDREPFLRAILEQPDDDGPRRVFADRLEEWGQAERAEVIRLQCRRAPGLVEHSALEGPGPHPRAGRARRRVRELLQRHGRRWAAEDLGWEPPGWGFRRGFVETVIAPAPRFALSGPAWARRVPLRAVALTRAAGYARDLADCPALAGLDSLAVYGADGAVAPALAASPHLGRLTRLVLAWGAADWPGLALLVGSPALPGLQSLAANSCGLGGDGFAEFVSVLAIWASGRLRSLALGGNGLGDATVAALAAAPALAGLEELALYDNDLSDAAVEALAASPHLARLRRLSLNDNRIGNAGAAALAASPHLAGLEYLGLGHNAVEGEGAEALWTARPRRPLELDLSYNWVSVEAARRLRASARRSRGRVIHLGENG